MKRVNSSLACIHRAGFAGPPTPHTIRRRPARKLTKETEPQASAPRRSRCCDPRRRPVASASGSVAIISARYNEEMSLHLIEKQVIYDGQRVRLEVHHLDDE